MLPVFILIGIILLVVILIFTMGYVKARTNEAIIISGLSKEPRAVIGRSTIMIPFLERRDKLDISQMSIDIKTNGYITTQDFIGVDIDAVAKVHVITERDVNVDENGDWLPGVEHDENTPKITKAMAWAAMRNFLNMKEQQIIETLTEPLQGNMREIIGTQTLKDLCNNRKGFGDQVQDKAQKDMNVLGIYIVSCNIQKITDKEGLIIALGQDNMSKIQKDASIAKAQADAEIAIEESKASKLANDARVEAELEIARKNNELELAKADLKIQEDVKRADADAAYKIQEQIKRKAIEIENANADIAKQEKEIEKKEKEAIVKERELDADVRKKADAERYEKEQLAAAELFERQRQAEAELFEEQKKADAAKAKAEAEAYAKKQQAEAIKALGEAEAEAIKAKGLAEAEAIDKKAEAMKKYGQAAMMEMVVGILPEVAKAIAEPMASVDKISIIDGGSGAGANSMYGFVTGGMQKVIESVKETTGLDLVEVMRADTYDAKVNHNVNITGDVAPNVNVNVPVAKADESAK